MPTHVHFGRRSPWARNTQLAHGCLLGMLALVGVQELDAQVPLFQADHLTPSCTASVSFSAPAPILPTTNCQRTESFGGGYLTTTLQMASRADYGGLGAALFLEMYGTSPGFSTTNGPYATARVSTVDYLTVHGGSGVGTLRVTTGVHGSFSFPTGSPFSGFVQSGWGTGSGPGNFYTGSGVFIDYLTFTFGVPFYFGRSLFLRIGGPMSGSGNWGPYAGTASYLNSADYSFGVFNNQGGFIRGATVAGADGSLYTLDPAPPVTATPEPATGFLVALGLLPIAAWRIRSRRRLPPATTGTARLPGGA